MGWWPVLISGFRRGTNSEQCRFTWVEDLKSSLSATYATESRSRGRCFVMSRISLRIHHQVNQHNRPSWES